MSYLVTITSTDGNKNTFNCGGATDQEALIYAGKIVEDKGDENDPAATVAITKDGKDIGPASTVRDMTTRAV